jgi:ATP-binding cassette subfamily C (CFTR/MRP) protein 4
MTSVERVYEYTELPPEAALESSPDNKPPPGWPSEGVILAEDASFRYTDDGPWVLHNLNFHIYGREKV